MDTINNPPLGSLNRNTLISFGNDSLDKFLGGGLLNSSLNIFERNGPSSCQLDAIWNKSLAAATLASQNNLIVIDFNTTSDLDETKFLASLPVPRKIKSEILYKDIRCKSATAQIKIAWRYSNRGYSPTDSAMKVNQVDFGLCLAKNSELNDLGKLRILRVSDKFCLREFFKDLEAAYDDLRKDNKIVNIIVKDVLHPFSPMIDDNVSFLKFLYAIRCYVRTLDKGALLMSYDVRLCEDYPAIEEHIYNLSDCFVSFVSYETGLNKLIGYKNTDGTLTLTKAPKINTFGLHFQPELSDWGYRLTKQYRYFVVDELSLPPCNDDEEDKSREKSAADLTNIGRERKLLEQVGPLEDFKEVAERVIPGKL